MQNEYVDKLTAPGFFEDLEKLVEGLDKATQSMAALSEAGLQVSKNLGSVSTFKDMIALTKTASDTNSAMSDSVGKVTAKVKEFNAEQFKTTLAIKEQIAAQKLKIQIEEAGQGTIAKAILEAK